MNRDSQERGPRFFPCCFGRGENGRVVTRFCVGEEVGGNQRERESKEVKSLERGA
jgi:hypothetical protein